MKTEEQKEQAKELARQRTRAWYQANKDRAKAKSVSWNRANVATPIEQRIVNRIESAELAKAVILLLEAKFDLYNADF
jgi:hypothetical protein